MRKFKLNPIICSEEPSGDANLNANPVEPQGSFQSFFSSLNGDTPDGAGQAQQDQDQEPQQDQVQEPGQDPQLTEPQQENPEIAALKAQIETLTSMITQQQIQPQQQAPAEPQGPTDPFESEAFTNLSTVMDWNETEQSAMKTFLRQVSDFNNQAAVSEAQKSIPEIVNSSLSMQEKQKAIKKQFFSEHPQLDQFKPLVSEVARNIVQEYKRMGRQAAPQMVLEEAAKRSYGILGIQQSKPSGNDNPNNPGAQQNLGSGSGQSPAFAAGNGGGSRKPPVKLTEDQKMISAIADLL